MIASRMSEQKTWSKDQNQLVLGKSQHLVLENLLRHRVGPFHNWNVHVDDLELVGPEKKG